MKKGERTREAILATAARYFDEKGYFLTSIDDIANNLHIAKGTLYQYFGSKQELFEVLIREAMNHVLERYENIGQEAKTLRNFVTGVLYETGLFLVFRYDFLAISLSAGSLMLSSMDEAFMPYRQITEKFMKLLEPYRPMMRTDPLKANIILTTYCNACRIMLAEAYPSGSLTPEQVRKLAEEFAELYVDGVGIKK